MLETNTGFGNGYPLPGTGINFSNIKTGDTSLSFFNIGAKGGYFVIDNLAIKLGLGYSKIEEIDGVFTYKLGAKYYISEQFPVQIDYLGSSLDNGGSFLGLQAGYAYFLSDKISIEPGIRYNIGLGDTGSIKIFQFNVGFAFFL